MRNEKERVPCSVPAKNPVKKSMRPHCIYHLPAVGRCDNNELRYCQVHCSFLFKS